VIVNNIKMATKINKTNAARLLDMEKIRIKSPHDNHFRACWEIYEKSFPRNERRAIDYHIETMQCEDFYFDAIFENNDIIGIIAWWDFESVRFIEHFATSEGSRNKGYGTSMLNDFKHEDDKIIILEVEPPTNELSCRRIAFYERIGFKLNSNLNYSHSPYWEGEKCAPLRIMSYPIDISIEQLTDFKSKLSIVHFRNF